LMDKLTEKFRDWTTSWNIILEIFGIRQLSKFPVPNRQYHHPTVMAVGFNGYGTFVDDASQATLIDNLHSLMDGIDPDGARQAMKKIFPAILAIGVQTAVTNPFSVPVIADTMETAKNAAKDYFIKHKMVTYSELMRMSLMESGWVGCFKDDPGRDLKSGPQTYGYTVASCRHEAEKEKKKYFALQDNGWCVTDNVYFTNTHYHKVADEECGTECVHETAEERVVKCGSAWKNAVYRTIPGDDVVYNGDTVYLKHIRLRYMYCDQHKCHANADCPSFGDKTRCSGEQITIYNPTNSGPIMNGQVVWLKWANSHFLRCLNEKDKCETGAGCPYSVEARKDESNDGCYGERFVMYNSLNSGPIMANQTVWLKLKRKDWLGCEGDRCDAFATCPENPQHRRTVTADTGCFDEGFVLEK